MAHLRYASLQFEVYHFFFFFKHFLNLGSQILWEPPQNGSRPPHARAFRPPKDKAPSQRCTTSIHSAPTKGHSVLSPGCARVGGAGRGTGDERRRTKDERRGTEEGVTDCHVGLRPPRNDRYRYACAYIINGRAQNSVIARPVRKLVAAIRLPVSPALPLRRSRNGLSASFADSSPFRGAGAPHPRSPVHHLPRAARQISLSPGGNITATQFHFAAGKISLRRGRRYSFVCSSSSTRRRVTAAEARNEARAQRRKWAPA